MAPVPPFRGSSSASASRSRSAGNAARAADVHQGRPADPPTLLSAVSSSRHVGADVADDLRRGAAVGTVDQADASPNARCRRGTSIAASANTSPTRRCRDQEIATIAVWVDGGAARGPARGRAAAADVRDDSPNGPTASPISSSAMEKGFAIPADGPDFIPDEIVDPKLTEDRYVKWVQIIPQAARAVHHAHVYVDLPEGIDLERPRPRHGLERRQQPRPDRVRRRQRRRHLPRWHDEGSQEGRDVPLRGALSPVRRADVRSPEGRHQVLSARRRADTRGHVTSHSHRRGQRLGAESRARRGCAAPRRSQAVD